ncbi:hypothetical protein ACI65C_008792 [Semiaphis heraclei]
MTARLLILQHLYNTVAVTLDAVPAAGPVEIHINLTIKMKRSKLSGDKYRKLAKEKLEKQRLALENVPKINTLFSKEVITSVSVSPKISSSVIDSGDIKSVQNVNEKNNTYFYDSTEIELQNKTKTSIFSKDPSQWIRTADFIQFVASNGVDQNMNSDFSNSKRI